MNTQETTAAAGITLTPSDLLEQWQGHRALTRRVIEAFPEEKLFTYTIGGMRPFGELAAELNQMAAPGAHGVATRQWIELKDLAKEEGLDVAPKTKAGILELWDWTTTHMNKIWEKLEPGRFQESDLAFGMYEGKVWWLCLYFIDNEIHHRGQGYVYLRSLGIAPPPFWER
ncbi:putative damage-inducible protein DinB [Anseongella ginsenosidimutans]|uniref:Putative damage-inducible protein DinB n=1 Tax=Anseongella ginsenosidimutans TaxID=496056 RepID=A0A4R3KWU0_9SPHI|nr:DinB family protein [Anseongella ginsenosidimutans]QEC51833.1 damage-inducible protein DinB [Anseongella ginsenosidimutans]TCS89206.1 putative damage-inducible protein DinB [Anseongella ginsenosidimutans]